MHTLTQYIKFGQPDLRSTKSNIRTFLENTHINHRQPSPPTNRTGTRQPFSAHPCPLVGFTDPPIRRPSVDIHTRVTLSVFFLNSYHVPVISTCERLAFIHSEGNTPTHFHTHPQFLPLSHSSTQKLILSPTRSRANPSAHCRTHLQILPPSNITTHTHSPTIPAHTLTQKPFHPHSHPLNQPHDPYIII